MPSFYNLVTDFYEWGWGQSFHFAPRRKGETFRESIRRAEYLLASRIEVRMVANNEEYARECSGHHRLGRPRYAGSWRRYLGATLAFQPLTK